MQRQGANRRAGQPARARGWEFRQHCELRKISLRDCRVSFEWQSSQHPAGMKLGAWFGGWVVVACGESERLGPGLPDCGEWIWVESSAIVMGALRRRGLRGVSSLHASDSASITETEPGFWQPNAK